MVNGGRSIGERRIASIPRPARRVLKAMQTAPGELPDWSPAEMQGGGRQQGKVSQIQAACAAQAEIGSGGSTRNLRSKEQGATKPLRPSDPEENTQAGSQGSKPGVLRWPRSQLGQILASSNQ